MVLIKQLQYVTHNQEQWYNEEPIFFPPKDYYKQAVPRSTA